METQNLYTHKDCIDACLQCTAACLRCSAMDLNEPEVAGMSRCIQLNMECAALCQAAVQLMALGSELSHEVCALCAQLCRRCAEECSRHNHEHCRVCAEACIRCAEACERM